MHHHIKSSALLKLQIPNCMAIEVSFLAAHIITIFSWNLFELNEYCYSVMVNNFPGDD